jgi:CMP/dCMP kinase
VDADNTIHRVLLSQQTLNFFFALKPKIVIAIDGPAASGKSTTAKLVAQKLGYTYVDTGAMYRAVTLKALRKHCLENALHDEAFLKMFLEDTHIDLSGSSVWLDGYNVSDAIRENEVSHVVSKISALKPVRLKLSEVQRKMGETKGVVMDGRDIGTAIFPNAELKVFMLASPKERAKRRYAELLQKHPDREPDLTLDELEQEIIERDTLDSSRDISPLRRADDAVLLDTSHLSIEQQVEQIYKLAIARIESLTD